MKPNLLPVTHSAPHTGVQQGIMLHSPAITLALVEALQGLAKAALEQASGYELRKLSAMGLKPATARYLASHTASAVTARIEAARLDAQRLAAHVANPRNPYKAEKLTAVERSLMDYGHWCVPVGVELLAALAAEQDARVAAQQVVLTRYLIEAGARTSTLLDLMGVGEAGYRAFCKRHRVKSPAPRIGGRPPLPDAALIERIRSAWQTICEEARIERVYGTLAEKYAAVHKHLLPDVDLAVIHGVVQGRVVQH